MQALTLALFAAPHRIEGVAIWVAVIVVTLVGKAGGGEGRHPPPAPLP